MNATDSDRLRLATYNVHGCVGTDGRLDVPRVAAVIAEAEADVIVLQELDVGRTRSSGEDQPERLAAALGMGALFSPSVHDGDERYGHAILSRRPLRLVRVAPLPPGRFAARREPRSAIWAEVDVGEERLQVIGTHLGLSPVERAAQVGALLGPELLGHPDFRGPRVLAGDLNVGPSALSYWRLLRGLVDAQRSAQKPRATFPSRRPLLRLDHVLVGDLRVVDARVVATPLARLASDHLPLVVDVAFDGDADRRPLGQRASRVAFWSPRRGPAADQGTFRAGEPSDRTR